MSGDSSYDCGLDESCLDSNGEVRAGRHAHHDPVIGGPCTHGCGDVAGHPGICLVTKLRSTDDEKVPEIYPSRVTFYNERDDLKTRVERLENKVRDLGAFVQAAVKEMRKHADAQELDVSWPSSSGGETFEDILDE